jgi:hypothetical protein
MGMVWVLTLWVLALCSMCEFVIPFLSWGSWCFFQASDASQCCLSEEAPLLVHIPAPIVFDVSFLGHRKATVELSFFLP